MVNETTKEDAELDGDQTVLEPKESKGWLALIATATKAFESYQLKCDNIEKLFANLEKLASSSREREFQLFWSNIQVLAPSIYSRPPIPVIIPRFKDRNPLLRTASETLERTTIVAIERENIDGVMAALRDDLCVVSRGVPWVRLGEKDKRPCVYIDHVHRRDFLHDPTRCWKENDWVSKCSWLSRAEALKRFKKTSGDAYQNAQYMVRKEDDDGYKEGDKRLKAPFHELWSKSQNLVVWVAEGCEKVLDEGPPHLELEGFFPCPEPVYGTCERGTLKPVPDVLFYKDQLEEINEITGRIAALTESLRVKGFYPAGAGNISDAIEAAMKNVQNNQILIPVADWAMLGTGNPKDIIVWVPIDQVAAVVRELIELRKQLIEDVYQLTGLSDVQRGSVDPNEKLGQTELKAQFGAVRIRDRQGAMVRIARDITRIVAEIIAENYDDSTVNEMSQMNLPTDAEIKKQLAQLTGQQAQIQQMVMQATQDPRVAQMASQDPEKAQAVKQQVQEQLQAIAGQIEEVQKTVTIDQVMAFLRDNRMRAFTLDIETDSTIQPDEEATKKNATEYVSAMSGLLQQAVPAVQAVPQMAPLMSEMIIFANKQFRIGRSMEQVVEEFADSMKQLASQPRPDPAAAEQQAEQQRQQGEMQLAQQKQAMEGEAQKAQQANDAETAKIMAAAQAEALTIKANAEARALAETTAANIAITNAKAAAEASRAEQVRLDQAQEHAFKMETLAMERLAMEQAAKERKQEHQQHMETAHEAHESNMAMADKKQASMNGKTA